MINNFYFFFINKVLFENENNANTQSSLNSNLLKIFYIKKNYKILNSFLKVINFIYILNIKNLKQNKVILKNKDNLLFFFFNKKIYSINYLDKIIDDNFLNFNIKNYYFSFFFSYLYYIKKFIFILKLKFFLKKCQH
jgi:hypothetical protein